MLDLIKKYRLFLAILATLITLLGFLFQSGQYSENPKLQTVSHLLAYPVQMLFHNSVNSVNGVIQSYVNLVNLHKENEQLKNEVQHLKEELNHYLEESIHYNRLKVQLEFAEENPEKKVFAEVIGESVDNFHQVLLINRGSEHGIQRNFPVILKEGVVGRIQSVSPYQASVQLILDQRNRFPAIVQRSRAKGIVYGINEGLELRRIDLRADVQVGDRVITNGLSGLFPKGLLVGIVNQVEHEEHELFQVARITPVVDFDKIEEVFVILKNTHTASLLSRQ
ncbi:MAG: rod shape-determining protein MreC [SAR324 cluster bacterium]|nr:rod shape-determining protein MreC [SAR324 cluster bacterium]